MPGHPAREGGRPLKRAGRGRPAPSQTPSDREAPGCSACTDIEGRHREGGPHLPRLHGSPSVRHQDGQPISFPPRRRINGTFGTSAGSDGVRPRKHGDGPLRRPRSRSRRPRIEFLEDRRLLLGPTFTEYPVNTSGISDLVEGPDGNMWFTSVPGNLIGELVLNPTKPGETLGRVLTYPIPTANSEPAHIISYGGALYFTEFNGNNIGEIDPSTGAIERVSTPRGRLSEPNRPLSAPFGIAAGPGGVTFTLSLFNALDNLSGGYLIDPLGGGGVVPAGSHPLEIKTSLDGQSFWFNLQNAGANAVGVPGESTLVQMTSQGFIDEHVPEAGSWTDFTIGPDGDIWGVRGIGHRSSDPRPGAMATPYSVVNPGSTTASVTTFNLGLGAPAVSVTSGEDGSLWFTDSDSDGGIGRVTPDGTVTRYATPTPGPNGPITVGPG